jgi:hypothetical protein
MGADGLTKYLHVSVLDVAPVFSQVYGYAVGTGQFAEYGCGYGVRFNGASCLADGGNVVYVDA